MKLSYFNILLFSLPLNILAILCHVNNQVNHYITPYTKKATKIPNTKLLSECDIYTSIYNNDSEMQKVIHDFDLQTSQRFKEYDERMMKNRKKCKEQCDKEIHKIILKDKIEKELSKQLTTLETNIETNDIPTCVCEKSLADKVEKTCLKCGGILGGGLAPESGLIGGTALYAISVWKPTAIDAAIAAAAKSGAAKGTASGIKAGIEVVMDGLYSDFGLSIIDVEKMGIVFNAQNYKDAPLISQAVYNQYNATCFKSFPLTGTPDPICTNVTGKFLSGNGAPVQEVIKEIVQTTVSQAEYTAGATAEMATEEATTLAIKSNTAIVNATCATFETAIIASIVTILVIVLIMVIINLILRYRRKTKIKKKLQYTKLLKE